MADEISQDVEVTISDKYHKDRGYSHLKVGKGTPFYPAVNAFATGQASMRDTAVKLIEIFFNRDFDSTGKHWDHNGPSASLLKKHDSGAESYRCECSSEWDWKDINALARSQAVITLSYDRKRIRIDDYSYYCAG